MTAFNFSELARTLTGALVAAVFAATCLAGAAGPAIAGPLLDTSPAVANHA